MFEFLLLYKICDKKCFFNRSNRRFFLTEHDINESDIEKIWTSPLDLETPIPILDEKFQGKVVRKLPFYEHLGRSNELATILKIGACNFSCPYCFRYSKAEEHQTIPLWKLLKIGLQAVNRDMIIRLSGGDPVAVKRASIEMIKFFHQQRGLKFSHGRVAVAHNGSSPDFVDKIAPHLEMIALDIKTTPQKYSKTIGLSRKDGKFFFERALQSIKIAEQHGILVEIRTPIFNDTNEEDLMEIGTALSQLNLDQKRTFWTLRLYNSVQACDWGNVSEDNIYPKLKKVARHFSNLNIGLRRDTISGYAGIERL